MTQHEIKMMHNLISNTSPDFLIQALDRMRSDCEYYLGYGLRNPEKLWAKDPDDQILCMRAIYRHLNEIGRAPDWITEVNIDNYLRRMSPKVMRISIAGQSYTVEDILSAEDREMLKQNFGVIRDAVQAKAEGDTEKMFEMFLSEVKSRLGIELIPVRVSAVFSLQ